MIYYITDILLLFTAICYFIHYFLQKKLEIYYNVSLENKPFQADENQKNVSKQAVRQE